MYHEVIEPAEREHGAPLLGKYTQALVAGKLTRYTFQRRQAGRVTCELNSEATHDGLIGTHCINFRE